MGSFNLDYFDWVHALAGAVIVLAQAALIAGLRFHRWRRRQAETQLRSRERELQNSYDRIRDIGRRLLTAQEDERSRIARELRDDLGQRLAALDSMSACQ